MPNEKQSAAVSPEYLDEHKKAIDNMPADDTNKSENLKIATSIPVVPNIYTGNGIPHYTPGVKPAVVFKRTVGDSDDSNSSDEEYHYRSNRKLISNRNSEDNIHREKKISDRTSDEARSQRRELDRSRCDSQTRENNRNTDSRYTHDSQTRDRGRVEDNRVRHDYRKNDSNRRDEKPKEGKHWNNFQKTVQNHQLDNNHRGSNSNSRGLENNNRFDKTTVNSHIHKLRMNEPAELPRTNPTPEQPPKPALGKLNVTIDFDHLAESMALLDAMKSLKSDVRRQKVEDELKQKSFLRTAQEAEEINAVPPENDDSLEKPYENPCRNDSVDYVQHNRNFNDFQSHETDARSGVDYSSAKPPEYLFRTDNDVDDEYGFNQDPSQYKSDQENGWAAFRRKSDENGNGQVIRESQIDKYYQTKTLPPDASYPFLNQRKSPVRNSRDRRNQDDNINPGFGGLNLSEKAKNMYNSGHKPPMKPPSDHKNFDALHKFPAPPINFNKARPVLPQFLRDRGHPEIPEQSFNPAYNQHDLSSSQRHSIPDERRTDSSSLLTMPPTEGVSVPSGNLPDLRRTRNTPVQTASKVKTSNAPLIKRKGKAPLLDIQTELPPHEARQLPSKPERKVQTHAVSSPVVPSDISKSLSRFKQCQPGSTYSIYQKPNNYENRKFSIPPSTLNRSNFNDLDRSAGQNNNQPFNATLQQSLNSRNVHTNDVCRQSGFGTFPENNNLSFQTEVRNEYSDHSNMTKNRHFSETVAPVNNSAFGIFPGFKQVGNDSSDKSDERNMESEKYQTVEDSVSFKSSFENKLRRIGNTLPPSRQSLKRESEKGVDENSAIKKKRGWTKMEVDPMPEFQKPGFLKSETNTESHINEKQQNDSSSISFHDIQKLKQDLPTVQNTLAAWARSDCSQTNNYETTNIRELKHELDKSRNDLVDSRKMSGRHIEPPPAPPSWITPVQSEGHEVFDEAPPTPPLQEQTHDEKEIGFWKETESKMDNNQSSGQMRNFDSENDMPTTLSFQSKSLSERRKYNMYDDSSYTTKQASESKVDSEKSDKKSGYVFMEHSENWSEEEEFTASPEVSFDSKSTVPDKTAAFQVAPTEAMSVNNAPTETLAADSQQAEKDTRNDAKFDRVSKKSSREAPFKKAPTRRSPIGGASIGGPLTEDLSIEDKLPVKYPSLASAGTEPTSNLTPGGIIFKIREPTIEIIDEVMQGFATNKSNILPPITTNNSLRKVRPDSKIHDLSKKNTEIKFPERIVRVKYSEEKRFDDASSESVDDKKSIRRGSKDRYSVERRSTIRNYDEDRYDRPDHTDRDRDEYRRKNSSVRYSDKNSNRYSAFNLFHAAFQKNVFKI